MERAAIGILDSEFRWALGILIFEMLSGYIYKINTDIHLFTIMTLMEFIKK
jgi:hypothetical protein